MRRLKKATPEFEEVDEGDAGEEGWVSYQSDNPNMTLLRPLLRTAEAMLDPTKPNSYHIKMSAAKKMVEAMGKEFTIEGDAIVRALPFKLEYKYKLNELDKAYNEPMYTQLRGFLERLPSGARADIEGISVFNEGKAPAQLKKGWLYISVPTQSTVDCSVNGRFGPDQTAIHGERLVPGRNNADFPRRVPRNGVSAGDFDFAVYAPQTVYVKIYISQTYMAYVIYSAIALGSQLAMGYEGGNVALKEWLPEAGGRYAEERRKRAEKVAAELKDYEAQIARASDTILTLSLKAEEAREISEVLSKPLATKDLAKELPGLALVDWVNRDDPYKTVIRTKDIVLHGVNLGPYVITMMHSTLAVAVMGTKAAPDGIVHPNIWMQDGKWHQDMPKDTVQELVKALGAGNTHLAANIIIQNLTQCPNSGDHAKRLEALKNAIEAREKKAAEKKAKKVEVKEEPKLEEATK